MHAGNGDKERGRKAEVHSCQSQEPDAVLATTPRSLYRRFNSRPLARLPLTTVVARKQGNSVIIGVYFAIHLFICIDH